MALYHCAATPSIIVALINSRYLSIDLAVDKKSKKEIDES